MKNRLASKKENDTTCFILLKDQHFLRSISERQADRCRDYCKTQDIQNITRFREPTITAKRHTKDTRVERECSASISLPLEKKAVCHCKNLLE